MTEEMKQYLQGRADEHARLAQRAIEQRDHHFRLADEAADHARRAAEFKELTVTKDEAIVTVKLDLDTTEAIGSIQALADRVTQITEQFNKATADSNAFLTESA